jgi:hypothetical protein
MKNSDFAEGVRIILKYLNGEDYDFQFEHDQIWFGEYALVTDIADIKRLHTIGWFESEDSWSCFN